MKGDQGPPGRDGGGATLSDATPVKPNDGTGAAGTGTAASRDDHKHPLADHATRTAGGIMSSTDKRGVDMAVAEIPDLTHKTADLSVTAHNDWGNVARVELGGFTMQGINAGDPSSGLGVSHTANAQGSSNFYNLQLRIPTGERPEAYRLTVNNTPLAERLTWSKGATSGGFDNYDEIGGAELLPRGGTVRLQKTTRTYHTSYAGDVPETPTRDNQPASKKYVDDNAGGGANARDIARLDNEFNDVQARTVDLHTQTEQVWANSTDLGIGIIGTVSGEPTSTIIRNYPFNTGTQIVTRFAPQVTRTFVTIRANADIITADYRLLWADGTTQPITSLRRRSDLDYTASDISYRFWIQEIEIPEDGKAPIGGTLQIQHHGANPHTRYSGDVSATPTRDGSPVSKQWAETHLGLRVPAAPTGQGGEPRQYVLQVAGLEQTTNETWAQYSSPRRVSAKPATLAEGELVFVTTGTDKGHWMGPSGGGTPYEVEIRRKPLEVLSWNLARAADTDIVLPATYSSYRKLCYTMGNAAVPTQIIMYRCMPTAAVSGIGTSLSQQGGITGFTSATRILAVPNNRRPISVTLED